MRDEQKQKINATAILEKKRVKATKQRILLLEILTTNDRPVCAEDIYLQYRASCPKGSISTVYRTLDLFAEKAIAVRSVLRDGTKAVYELSGDIHKHHLTCMSCGTIIAIEGCPLGEYEKKLQSRTGYEIVEHRLDLYGVCPECRKNENSAKD